MRVIVIGGGAAGCMAAGAAARQGGARWAAFYNWLNENELLDGQLDPNFGYTNEYLP